MNTFALAVLLAAGCAAAMAQAVPVEREPLHHLVLENRSTRVYFVEVPPHQSTLVHRHRHDYVAVILGPADIQNALEGQPVTTAKLAGGEVRFTPGGFSHRAINVGNTPFRNVTIEILKKKTGVRGKSERGLEVGHGGLVDTVIDNPEVRADDVQIAPGGMLHKHRHARPYLLVAVSDLQLHETPGAMLHLKAGEVKWMPPATHELMNMGAQPAHFVTVEFK